MIGGLLVLCGLLYMAGSAIRHGRLSDARLKQGRTPTLEPQRRTLAFLGPKANWPGLLLIVLGAVLLIAPTLLGGPGHVDGPAGIDGGGTTQ